MNFDERIQLEPQPARLGEPLKIKYDGLLKNSGAEEVYLHYGHDGWKESNSVLMHKLPDGKFAAEITAKACQEINFCFKDKVENWDNNSGFNWKCDVV